MNGKKTKRKDLMMLKPKSNRLRTKSKKYGMSFMKNLMLIGIRSISWIFWNGNIESKKENAMILKEKREKLSMSKKISKDKKKSK